MGELIRLSNAVASELAKLHGSHTSAARFRARTLAPERPASGAGVVQERVLIVNDLHIGAGRDPDTFKYHPGDDFTDTQTRQFLAFLVNEWRGAATGDPALGHPTRQHIVRGMSDLTWADKSPVDVCGLGKICYEQPAYPLTLCINGDFVDFLQTTVERPAFPYPDGMTPDGRAPKNTPANAIMQLNMIRAGHAEIFRALAVHIRLGHKLDIIPGNHDRHFWNKHVWEGRIEVEGKTFPGFLGLLERELVAAGADKAEVSACLARVQRKPFSVYADKWVEHGDMGDRANRVQRPLGELFDPSPLHQEMSMAVGDYGVRGSFNAIEVLDPTLDAIQMTGNVVKMSFKHPLMAVKLLLGFLRGFTQEGHTVSRQADQAQREADVKRLVDEHPLIVEQLNALRPPEERLSSEQVKAGLVELERVASTPVFSNFKKGTGLFTRLFHMAKETLRGRFDHREKDTVYLDQIAARHRAFGINASVHGHTHTARDDLFLCEDEKLLRYVNTHTWMSKVGDWGRPSVTWGGEGRGVGVIEIGVDAQGRSWSELALRKVIDEQGHVVEGDLLEDREGLYGAKKDVGRARVMHERVQKTLAASAERRPPRGLGSTEAAAPAYPDPALVRGR